MNALWKTLRTESNELLLMLAVVGILVVLFTPIPAGMLDFLLLANFSVALLILLVTFHTEKPLSFSTFPSLLLMTTLFRLSLNIAATRLILANADAGKVIHAVGTYVVGGNYVIGLVVFLILIVVQYVVVTNGAQRVAEVAARFTLDSLPGKQMSIDADLNMGLIDQEEAKKRRSQLEKESNFYGAMDGASKFVKGDAIAGIIIILINIIGGLSIGMLQHDMSWSEALARYTLLTVGDGIVTQIPSLIIAVGTGIIITRAATDARLGQEIVRQVSAHPKTMGIVALALFLLMLLPGLPVWPLALLGGGFAAAAWFSWRAIAKSAIEEAGGEAAAEEGAAGEDSDFMAAIQTQPFELKLGAKLAQGLLGADSILSPRVDNLRRQLAKDLGLTLPALAIRTEQRLAPNAYAIHIHGAQVASGELELERLLAINPGNIKLKLEGIETREPTYGLAAEWILPEQKNQAKGAGYTLVEPETVLTTHLSELARRNAPDFLSRAETERLIERARPTLGSLPDELIPQVLSYSDIQRVLQLLLREQVPVRNLERILEVLVDAGRTVKNHEELAERVREKMGAILYDRLVDRDGSLNVITISPRIESYMLSAMRAREGQGSLLPAQDIDGFIAAVVKEVERQLGSNRHAVLLCAGPLRRTLRALLWRAVPHLTVLSVNEIGLQARIVSSGVIDIPGFTGLEVAA
jgi:flagellar biosynthesis protein FlhA